jgi:non-canonical purine NTP pyrophosphatase (RdgB/HAM1 family)
VTAETRGTELDSIIRFATSNELKFSEARALHSELVQLEMELPELQAVDISHVVADKMESLALMDLDYPVVVEDTGLEVSTLSGLPGALVKWFIGSLGSDGLARIALDGRECVPAVAASAVGAVWGAERRIWVGRTEGFIVKPLGQDFGWNAVFRPVGMDLTFGQLGAAERLAVSMRKKPLEDAFRWLVDMGAT